MLRRFVQNHQIEIMTRLFGRQYQFLTSAGWQRDFYRRLCATDNHYAVVSINQKPGRLHKNALKFKSLLENVIYYYYLLLFFSLYLAFFHLIIFLSFSLFSPFFSRLFICFFISFY